MKRIIRERKLTDEEAAEYERFENKQTSCEVWSSQMVTALARTAVEHGPRSQAVVLAGEAEVAAHDVGQRDVGRAALGLTRLAPGCKFPSIRSDGESKKLIRAIVAAKKSAG